MGDPPRPATGYPFNPTHQPNGYPSQPTSSGTAYPYQAPPPNPYYYHQDAHYANQRAAMLRRLFAGLVVVTVIFFTILFILWLVVRPRLPEFRVTSLSVNHFNVSTASQRVSGNWIAQFEVYNPNKKLKINYNQIVSFIYYKREFLAETRVPPFKQDTKNLTTLGASFSVVDSYVDQKAVNGINGDRAGGSIGFDLRLGADVGYKVGGFQSRRRILRVVCENVLVGVSGNSGSGNLTGGAKQCLVYAILAATNPSQQAEPQRMDA